MSDRPNVLMIAFDDLNDWVGCLGGHPDVRAPNLDRLAARGTLFANNHCQAPLCNPSRTSLLYGVRPSSSGVYDNCETHDPAYQKLRDTRRNLPQYLRDHGYRTLTAGKLFHHYWDHNDAFDTVGPQPGYRLDAEVPKRTDLDDHVHELWDFGPQDFDESDFIDHRLATWAADELGRRDDPRPMFIAVGLAKPHVPFFPPRRCYEDAKRTDPLTRPVAPSLDEDNVPQAVRQVFHSPHPPTHDWMEADPEGRWDEAVHCYIACIHWVDEQVGRILDALDSGPYAEDTAVVLWSDHGMHFGEKRHWAKWTLWERSTHVPLIICPPGRQPPDRCDRPTENLSIYPTILDLCGLPANPGLEGRSLAPLLQDPNADWPHAAITTLYVGNHAVRTDRFRYVHYAHGSQELFDHATDPLELRNIAHEPENAEVLNALRRHLPKDTASGSGVHT